VQIGSLVRLLNDAFFTKAGTPLTIAMLTSVVESVTRVESTNPDPDSVALIPRLVWQLGLLHKPRQDLTLAIPAAKVSLDPLQAWLITADFLLPLVYGNKPPASPTSGLATRTNNIVTHRSLSVRNCDQLKVVKKVVQGGGKYLIGLAAKTRWTVVKYIVKGAAVVPIIIDAVHEIVTSIGVQVHGWPTPGATKLGGPNVTLSLQVRMTIKLPDWVISCGWLSGDDFPKPGPIPGIGVGWFANPTEWGTIECGDGCRSTGPDGIAREVFKPDAETSNSGALVTEHLGPYALPFVNLSSGNLLGALGDIFRGVTIPFELNHYARFPTGFDATGTVTSKTTDGYGDTIHTAITFTASGGIDPEEGCTKTSCSYVSTKISGTISTDWYYPVGPTYCGVFKQSLDPTQSQFSGTLSPPTSDASPNGAVGVFATSEPGNLVSQSCGPVDDIVATGHGGTEFMWRSGELTTKSDGVTIVWRY
jgi:hypothetical protein